MARAERDTPASRPGAASRQASGPLEGPVETEGRRVDVSDISRKPGAVRAFAADLEMGDLSVPLAAISGPVHVSGMLEGVLEGVVLVARISADVTEVCRRCLEERTRRITIEVTELFTPSGDDDETYRLDDAGLDLDQCARDALALELPDAPLLCEGDPEECPNLRLVRELGFADRPDSDRPEKGVDPRWAPLAGLKSDLEKEQ